MEKFKSFLKKNNFSVLLFLSVILIVLVIFSSYIKALHDKKITACEKTYDEPVHFFSEEGKHTPLLE
jgi:hypothetical protein